MIAGACLCGALPSIITQTRIVVVGHVFELDRPTNTTHLAHLMLPELDMIRRGGRPTASRRPNELGATSRVAPADGGTTALLYPSEDAAILTAEWAHQQPQLTLVLADGTWPQARRAVRREPCLAKLPRLRLPDGPPTQFWLRDQVRTDQHLCTLEAIARALGIIEGHRVEAQLIAGLETFVRRILASRGRLRGPQAHSSAPAAIGFADQ